MPERLRHARRLTAASMTATSLEAALSSNSVYRIERRLVMPRIDTVERIAASLAVSAGWLAYGDGAVETPSREHAATGIGARLRATRTSRGLTRAGLGAAAQTTRQTIGNIETGKMIPKVDTVELLAKALGVPASWVAFGEGLAPALAAEQSGQISLTSATTRASMRS